MANKIQLRRDTAANWNRVNPILDDGEPGLDITTNKIKYGDGANAWVDLSYASGGSGSGNTLVNGSYIVSLGPDGILTTATSMSGNLTIGEFQSGQAIKANDGISLALISSGTNGSCGLEWADNFDSIGNVAAVIVNSPFTNGAVQIFTGQPTMGGATNIWTFDRDGNLTFPQGTLLGYSDPGGFIIDGAVDKDVAIYTYSGSDAHGWTFGADGNLTLPAGGEIHSASGTGPVAIQSNDGVNNFTWDFNSTGSISLPALLTGAQGNGSLDSNNNLVSLNSSDTVDFHNFSGMILVNCHNSGNVTLYLCGGGSGDAVALGSSKGTALGSLAFNNSIGGYTFTASETGDHVFFAIRTRTGA